MLKTTLLVIAALIAVVLLYATTRPDSFRVARSASIKAPPERLHALINDMHAFNTWNPYARKDPTMKGSYTGPTSGKGAAYAWESDKVGTGSLEIIDTAVPGSVAMKLDFVKPFEAHNTAAFTIQPEAGATRVTWAMQGPVPYLAKLMHLFFNMDQMVGKDFEDGLANLKTLAEAR
jgi:Polyketide cyclase / dehydrase and lipid transport